MQTDSAERSLHSYIAERNVEAVRESLQKGVNPNAVDAKGNPTTWVASVIGDAAILSVLLSAGADPDARSPDRATPLMHAALNGNEHIATLLIRGGADVNARDEHGATALILAAEQRHLAVVKALLDSGADPNARAHDGRTALSAGVWQTVETRVEGSEYYKRAVRVSEDDPLLRALIAAGARD